MKIGILTYHRAYNYGALFQAYGLMKYLQLMGHDAELIDYWPTYHAKDYELFPSEKFSKLKLIHKVKYLIFFLTGLSRMLKRKKGYDDFMKNSLNLPDKTMFSSKEVIAGEYDAIFCGSDQIWRKHNFADFNKIDEVYFGNCPVNTIKKYSYAASMGVLHEDAETKSFLRKQLPNFDKVSVRESDLKLLLSDIGFESTLVLDPVFLLDKNEWYDISNNKTKKEKEKYIFFYHHMDCPEAEKLVDKLKKKYNCSVRIVRSKVYPFLFGKDYTQSISPYKFLELIANAEAVVSTSFHGVAFSIIFEKQFYALGMGKNSKRVETLLDSIGIKQQLNDDISQFDLDKSIDYVKVNNLLNKKIEASKNYIRECIK